MQILILETFVGIDISQEIKFVIVYQLTKCYWLSFSSVITFQSAQSSILHLNEASQKFNELKNQTIDQYEPVLQKKITKERKALHHLFIKIQRRLKSACAFQSALFDIEKSPTITMASFFLFFFRQCMRSGHFLCTVHTFQRSRIRTSNQTTDF